MILFSLLTTLLVSIVFYIKRDITWAMFTFIIMMLFYTFVIYGVMPEAALNTLDVPLFINIVSIFGFVTVCKYVMDKYLVSEVGHDLSDLIFTIFPDRRLKLFVLFFIGQIAFSEIFLINILIIYFIGKILKIDSILIMIIGMISLLINNIFDASYIVTIQDYINNSDYAYVDNISIIFLVTAMVASFIAIFMSILFIKDDKDDDFINILKEDWLAYLIIIVTYFVLLFIGILFFNINTTQTIISIVMLGVISIVSIKLMKHNHEFMENENKKYPFIFSIAIFIINVILILFANYALIIAFLIFSLFNLLVIRKYKSYEDENLLLVNIDSKFVLKIIGLGIFIYYFITLIVNSDINTTNVNTSILDSVVAVFSTLNSPVEIFIFFTALGPVSLFMPLNELVLHTASTDFVVLVIFFSSFFASFNILIFYLLHDLLGVDDSQSLVGYHAIMAFTIIIGLLLTIIVLIGG